LWLTVFLHPGLAAAQPGAPITALNLDYRVEWRMIEAGRATLQWTPAATRAGQAKVHLESVGLLNALYPVRNDYATILDEKGCTLSTLLRAEERSKKRETLVTYDRIKKLAQSTERDLVKNTSDRKEVNLPGCTFDVIGALVELRRQPRLEPGMALSVPVSDGKKFVDARVEVQAKEKVKTPAGEFDAIRTEAFLFDGALYARKARLHIWFSDDAQRIPIQIRVAMRLHFGNVTLQLAKRP
jgi:hypothetical protein